MEGQTTGTTEVIGNEDQTDPWVAAFAALEQKDQIDTPPTAGAGDGGSDTSADGADGGEGLPPQAGAGQAEGAEGDDGGSGDTAEPDDIEGRTAFAGMPESNDKEIEEYEQSLMESIRNQTMNDIAREFLKRPNVRSSNGVLGASIEDEDICKRDEDGVPHFYNPETGREFNGDNPRRQAQEWCDDYNNELAKAFNKACSQYEKYLLDEAAPGLAVMKFKPKYEKLDDIRRGMFDNVIQDYEIKDNAGKVVGYSCDLDKALALVDRQIAMIQDYAKQHQGSQKQANSTPALDMKTSSGAVPNGNDALPGSLEEAMERLQDKQLASLRK